MQEEMQLDANKIMVDKASDPDGIYQKELTFVVDCPLYVSCVLRLSFNWESSLRLE